MDIEEVELVLVLVVVGSGEVVLVVDDEVLICLLVVEVFNEVGYVIL